MIVSQEDVRCVEVSLGGFRCAARCVPGAFRGLYGASRGRSLRKKRQERPCAVRSHASSAAVAPPGPERPAESGRGSPPDSYPSTDAFGMDRFFGNVGVDANKASKLRFGKDSSPSAVKRGHVQTSSSSSDSASSTNRGHAAMVIANIPSVTSSSRKSDPISVRRPVHTARAPCDSTPRGAYQRPAHA